MELEDPSRLPELMAKLGSDSVKPRIQAALASLDYVHFARFLPLWDRGLLMIITEFDGAMPDYVMDFAAVLDDEFSLILSYMKGQPPLPVSRYPEQFWQYVDKNTGPKTTDPARPNPLAYPDVFSDYPGLTALEIAGASREKGGAAAEAGHARRRGPGVMCRPTRSAATRRRWPATSAFSSKAPDRPATCSPRWRRI